MKVIKRSNHLRENTFSDVDIYSFNMQEYSEVSNVGIVGRSAITGGGSELPQVSGIPSDIFSILSRDYAEMYNNWLEMKVGTKDEEELMDYEMFELAESVTAIVVFPTGTNFNLEDYDGIIELKTPTVDLGNGFSAIGYLAVI